MSTELENLLVDEYVSPIQYFADTRTPIAEIKKNMDKYGFRHIPVIIDQRAVGIISDRDISLAWSLGPDNVVVAEDIMATDPYCVTLGTTIDRVAFDLSHKKIGSAIVVDMSGNVEGIFTSTDALNALIEVVRGF